MPLVFTQASTACYLLVTAYILPHILSLHVALPISTVAPPHVSEAVGALNTGLAGHSTVPLLPWPPSSDVVVSTTCKVCLTVPLGLQQAYTAFQLLVEEYVLPHVPAVVVAPSYTTVA